MEKNAAIELEIDRNYEVFKPMVRDLIRENRTGQYALMRRKAIVGFFSSVGDAYRSGVDKFDDRLFSVQQVTDKPLDLGYFSHGGSNADL